MGDGCCFCDDVNDSLTSIPKHTYVPQKSKYTCLSVFRRNVTKIFHTFWRGSTTLLLLLLCVHAFSTFPLLLFLNQFIPIDTFTYKAKKRKKTNKKIVRVHRVHITKIDALVIYVLRE